MNKKTHASTVLSTAFLGQQQNENDEGITSSQDCDPIKSSFSRIRTSFEPNLCLLRWSPNTTEDKDIWQIYVLLKFFMKSVQNTNVYHGSVFYTFFWRLSNLISILEESFWTEKSQNLRDPPHPTPTKQVLVKMGASGLEVVSHWRGRGRAVPQ